MLPQTDLQTSCFVRVEGALLRGPQSFIPTDSHCLRPALHRTKQGTKSLGMGRWKCLSWKQPLSAKTCLWPATPLPHDRNQCRSRGISVCQ